MDTPKLFHFTMSHYNEKVRWALDFKDIAHVRRTLVPVFHIPIMYGMTRQTQVPVLELNGKRIIGSDQIIDALEQYTPTPPLYPDDRASRQHALDLAAFFDKQIGPHVRRICYHLLLPHTNYMVKLYSQDQHSLVRIPVWLSFPLMRPLVEKAYRVDETGFGKSQQKLVMALDRLEQEIQPSGYLVGEDFTVADLTAAALLSPLTMPSELDYPFPEGLPEIYDEFCEALAKRVGFQWGLEIYRKHRIRP